MSEEAGISDQGQIAALLNSIQRHQLPVNLLAASASAPEPSMLLAGSFANRELLFDAPRDLDSGQYSPGTVITVMAIFQGAELRFDANVIDTDSHEGYPALRTSWPRNVVSRQRRKAFRVRIGDDMSTRLELYDDAGSRLRGQLTDLSLGGFGALIDHSAPLSLGEEIDSSLEIDGVVLSTTIRMQDIRTPPQGRFMRIGVSFTELTPQQQSQLEKLIRALERHAIRSDGVRR